MNHKNSRKFTKLDAPKVGLVDCPRCQSNFFCGAGVSDRPCWCTELPSIQISDEKEKAHCFCPECLSLSPLSQP